jgi:tRNA A37 threonylcarbamoyltransferase TsaD
VGCLEIFVMIIDQSNSACRPASLPKQSTHQQHRGLGPEAAQNLHVLDSNDTVEAPLQTKQLQQF